MKKTNITLSIALAAVFSSSMAFAEAEVTGKIVHESAKFTTSGIGIGAATTRTQTANSHGKDNFKQETTAKIYIDGDADELHEGATYHVELNLMKDGKALNNYDSNESYTQRDALREAYVDMEQGDWSIRAGKQQVVWGTADGMKLLDAINPTDYSEMAQNQMEDSRIPVWMINAETDVADGGSWQAILSEAKSNKIAGLGISSGKARTHTNGDSGNAFIMKGVDTITGKVNGFMNLAPAMGQVARFFGQAGGGQLPGYTGATVYEFINNDGTSGVDSASERVDFGTSDFTGGRDAGDFFGLCGQVGGTNGTGTANCLSRLANDIDTIQTGAGELTKGSNSEVTNLIQTTQAEFSQGSGDADTVFEYMDQATFATFDSFANLDTTYKVVSPSGDSSNKGLRYKNSTESGLNWSINYLNHYDANPYVDLSWEDASGNALTPVYSNAALNSTSTFMSNTGAYTSKNTNAATTTITLERNGSVIDPLQNHITRSTGAANLGVDTTANLIFTEKLNRINSFGGSFDYSIETELSPVVFRGEFLYDQDVKVPVVDRAALRIGDLEMALRSENADFFKYVLGADITVMTNLMLSGQIIQIRNLDYIDESGRAPTRGAVTSNVTGVRYTADSATLHMSNGLNKAEENKEFYSLFLSKPFGASAEHRWNNIFMFEENGGKWNRLDAEFSIDDDTQATVEYNKYWGDANTQFGQLEKSSNIQVGVKYSF